MLRLAITAILLWLTPLYGASADDEACRVIRNEVETTAPRVLSGRESGQHLGTLCGYSNVECDGFGRQISIAALEKRGLSLKRAGLDYLLDGSSFIEIAEVDIDNDQVPDLRLWQVVGSAGCQKNYIFIRTGANSYTLRKFEEFDTLTTEGGFCYDDTLIVSRYKQTNYLVAFSPQRTAIFRGTPGGSLVQACSFTPIERWSEDQKQVADLVRKSYPNMPSALKIQRPELERLNFDNHAPFARKGDLVWTVVAKCGESQHAYAIFMVHPKRRDIRFIIEPGGTSSRGCN